MWLKATTVCVQPVPGLIQWENTFSDGVSDGDAGLSNEKVDRDLKRAARCANQRGANVSTVKVSGK